MDQNPPTPSILRSALKGYGIAALVATIVALYLSSGSDRFNLTFAFRLVLSLGALGAYIGYCEAVKRRRALGVSQPSDEWSRFFGSKTSVLLAFIVIAGSFVIVLVVGGLYNLVAG